MTKLEERLLKASGELNIGNIVKTSIKFKCCFRIKVD